MDKEIVVRDDPIAGFAGIVRAGPLLFASGCDGHRDPATNEILPELWGNGSRQSEISYGRMVALLDRAGAKPAAVTRIDHFVSSMDWIDERQVFREKIFGRPAPQASTGVAAKLSGLNMVTTAVVATVDPADHEVLVTGDAYGIGAISGVVCGGPLLFVTGIRGYRDHLEGKDVAEETPAAFAAQTEVAYRLIKHLLEQAGAGLENIVRLDCYVRDRGRIADEQRIRREALGDIPVTATMMPLAMGLRGEVEITALAVAPSENKDVLASDRSGQAVAINGAGYVFIGECLGAADANSGDPIASLAGDVGGQIDHALTTLGERLNSAGSDVSRVARLDVLLRDINAETLFLDQARALFGDDPPALYMTGAELADINEVSLCAIAV
jgi:enamine deaminase RidA (YjgF/YER057c/UK114 family)